MLALPVRRPHDRLVLLGSAGNRSHRCFRRDPGHDAQINTFHLIEPLHKRAEPEEQRVL